MNSPEVDRKRTVRKRAGDEQSESRPETNGPEAENEAANPIIVPESGSSIN